MKIYITRHGQVLPQETYGDAQFPAGDPPLTEIGRKQAEHLGNYLKTVGFHGNIYSSPYARALETAELIADKTGSKIYPWAPMREIIKTDEAANSFTGMKLSEIKLRFKHISDEAKLDFPWWSTCRETSEDVKQRIFQGFRSLSIEGDVLFVGHGATLMSMIDVLDIPKKAGYGHTIHPYNCSLSMLDTDNRKSSRFLDTAHLPYMLLTMNTVVQSVIDNEKIDQILSNGIDIPKKIMQSNSPKLLHIGDTCTYTYPYYSELIKKINPDIIIHTGDFVDEVKVGRMPSAKEEYEKGLIQIADILKQSNAKEIYIVPGNNDVLSLMEKHMSFATPIMPDTQITINGIPCTLTHSCFEITKKSQWHFYGHGLTGDTHKPETNDLNGTCYFNVMWGPKVFLLSEKKAFSFERP